LVDQRDDLALEYVTVLNLVGRHDEALDRLLARHFHPWEGGEGKVTGQYVLSLVELARQSIGAGDERTALELLERARHYPPTLGEGKLFGARENNIDYYLGCAYEGLGEAENARRSFAEAAQGAAEIAQATYYNDQPPDMIFYQGLALQKLRQAEAADQIFHRFIAYGTEHLDDLTTIDYFAVSLPDFLVFEEDLNNRHKAHCYYMIALGALGLGKYRQAQAAFDRVLSLDANHVGAMIHRKRCEGA
ncbi:MAG TPA: hypothetical protein VHD90_11730, partial [Phototrophicaceae bacterium]|nr:hypothetical protein [Phototrophicaceae bacterium]